jgi:hypothetical protein
MTSSKEEIEKIWQAYQKHPSAYFAAAICGVSLTTAAKYRDEEHWDERLQEIRDNARSLADADAARQLLVQKTEMLFCEVKIRILKFILEQIDAGDYKPTVRDLEGIVRLEQSHKGGAPDSGNEQSSTLSEWLDNDKGGKTLLVKKPV